MSAIKIGNKEFTVETHPGKDGRKSYILTGKRGAKYGTSRNQNNPDIIFLINLRSFGMAPGFETTYLTDKGGELRQIDVLWTR